MTKPRGLIQGVGINDANYPYRKQELIDGKYKIVWQCPIHSMWKDLLRRCFNERYKEEKPCYKEVTCCEEWLLFSNFKKWVDSQGSLYDVDNTVKHLDKDLLNPTNKLYSPNNCLLVSRKVNNFFLDGKSSSTTGVRGVTFKSDINIYHVFCKDPFDRSSKFLGKVYTAEEGRELYNKTKLKYFNDLYKRGYISEELYFKLLPVWFGDKGVFKHDNT